jgi:hypothetical protein
MLKKLTLLLILLLSFNFINAQIATEPRTEEYATVRVVMSSQTGTISSNTTIPNPFLEMEIASMELKDIIRDPKGAKFENVAEILNYMNKFGWLLLTSQTAEIPGSKTGDFIMYYTFKRKPKSVK